MKFRQGFVSNSSSASFVIPRAKLSELQIEALMLYPYSPENTDGWDIEVSPDSVVGDAIMDNDAIDDLFKKYRISMDIVEWEDNC